jgi:predicted Rdx family selenoprotein
VGGGSN